MGVKAFSCDLRRRNATSSVLISSSIGRRCASNRSKQDAEDWCNVTVALFHRMNSQYNESDSDCSAIKAHSSIVVAITIMKQKQAFWDGLNHLQKSTRKSMIAYVI